MTKIILSGACLSVCLLAVITPSFGAEMSVIQYMELEDAAVNKDTGSPVVNVYLMAVLDSYGISNAMLSDRKQRQLYCQPDNLALGPMNLRQLINDRLKKKSHIDGQERLGSIFKNNEHRWRIFVCITGNISL